MGTDRADASRLGYLDQFRGYTVLGMFFVNFVGGYLAIPALFKHHHTYCSYADTIMPQFLLAVGFSFRLTFERRRQKDGLAVAVRHALKRNLALLLIGLVVHHLDGVYRNWADLERLGPLGVLAACYKRSPFQTLTHIAVTSLWVLPVIGARPIVRLAWLAGSATLFAGLSHLFYYRYVMAGPPGIDGGPLGFLTWTIPLLVGSLACDAAANRSGPSAAGRWLAAALVLMLLGYGMSCLNRVTPPNQLPEGASWNELLVEPPFAPPPVPDLGRDPGPWARTMWMMSQRAGSASYQTFAAGFALLVLTLFLVLSAARWRWRYLDFLGQTALAGYVVHDLVAEAVKPFVPRDAPLWYVLAGFAVFLTLVSLLLRWVQIRI
jgi:predicted acyltransferase